MSRTCPYCGTELPDDSLFCIRCGEQVREGGSLSGTGTAPGQPEFSAENMGPAPVREVPEAKASVPQSGQSAGAESTCPAQAEGTTAERVQETGAPKHAEPDGTPGAASLRKGNARRGVFALVRIFGSWGALFVMALLSLMKIGRLSVSGIKIDLSIFDLMNVLPQQNRAETFLNVLAGLGLTAVCCILLVMGTAGLIRFFREGKSFPAERYAAGAFSAWVACLVFMRSVYGQLLQPGPASIAVLVIVCVLFAAILFREGFVRRAEIVKRPLPYLLRWAAFAAAALALGLAGGSFAVLQGRPCGIVMLIRSLGTLGDTAPFLIWLLALETAALLALGTLTFARTLIGLPGGKGNALGLAIAFFCVALALPVTAAIGLTAYSVGAGVIVCIIFAAAELALQVVIRLRKCGEETAAEESGEAAAALEELERSRGVPADWGRILRISAAVFGYVTVLLSFIFQFIGLYPVGEEVYDVIRYAEYVFTEVQGNELPEYVLLCAVLANFWMNLVVFVLATVKGIGMLVKHRYRDLNRLTAVSLCAWLLTLGFFIAAGREIGSVSLRVYGVPSPAAPFAAVGLLIASILLSRAAGLLTDASARSRKALEKCSRDALSLVLLTLWFKSFAYLFPLAYWDPYTSSLAQVFEVVFMLAAIALAVTGGTLWCRALSAAAGGKRECRLGLTVGSLVLSALGLLSYAIIAAETGAAFLFAVCFVLAFSVAVTVLEAKYPLVKKQKILYDREGQFKGGAHQ